MAGPVGPKPNASDRLRIAVKAFSKQGFVLPSDVQTKMGAKAIKETARAIQHISRKQGVSPEKAKKMLVRTAELIHKRDDVLRRAKSGKLSAMQVHQELKGIPKDLLKKKTSTFVTPSGTYEISGRPGERPKRRLLPAQPKATTKPTPIRTPQRRY